MTTTSSGAGAIEEWFGWWLAVWKLDATVTDVTQAMCAVNLAGPKAREILGGLSDLDVSPEGFKYLDGKQARVAGVDALLLRIGFVGEVGYEIHFPSAYGEHVWDALDRRRARGRSASSRSASCACRSCTSSSARTRTRSRRPTARPCPGSSSSTRSRTSSAAGRSSTPRSIRPSTRSSASR